ncbi:pyridoxamine 5'-phosphate oxidase family protein [Nocardia blacklockiae]|uniref:pyridoxamine 5'-phosphate oxidase family protein n=1 Tax=Nocardia blacklockiae TaxID=480036 RepID=UPI001894F820|nr:pyridoxamine 5'-phosphate oxidase family protein [Nocardia blacklockiae]MBF6175194.1 pyridoxamine 5'-phosphate oxidase family protein [Nocardia blacklockiae]
MGTGLNERGDLPVFPLVTALGLLEQTRVGRLIYIHHALPTLHPAGHLREGPDLIVFLARSVTMSPHRQVVSYQADAPDPATGRRWCVLVTGICTEITDPTEKLHYRTLLPAPVPGPRPRLLRIHPELARRIENLDDS